MAKHDKRSDVMAGDQAMIDGVQKFQANFASLPVGSQIVTPADILKVFQDRLDAAKAVQRAEASHTAAVKAYRDEQAKTAAFVQALRRIVLGTFQQSPDTLAMFGLKTPKVVKKTVEVKAAAVAKSKATRAARHTSGKKAKQAIKGAPPAATSAATVPPATAAKP